MPPQPPTPDFRPDPSDPPKSSVNWRGDAARYSGIGLQAAAVLVGFVLLGREADAWLELKRPLLTAASALLGCVAVVVWLIYRLAPNRR